jgi:hypothetical protein
MHYRVNRRTFMLERYDVFVRILLISLVLALAACSSSPDTKQSRNKLPEAPLGADMATNKHPLAKFIEVAGIRMEEAGKGKLKVTMAVINHSDADISDLGLKVKLTTTAAKPEDAPIAQFDLKVPSLGPNEMKDASAIVPTEMRLYELPDWQFLRAQYEITSPALEQ